MAPKYIQVFILKFPFQSSIDALHTYHKGVIPMTLFELVCTYVRVNMGAHWNTT